MGALVLVCERILGGKSYGSHQGPKVATCSATLFDKASSRQPPTGGALSPKGQPHPTELTHLTLGTVLGTQSVRQVRGATPGDADDDGARGDPRAGRAQHQEPGQHRVGVR